MDRQTLGHPPERNRVIGRALGAIVARAPWLWPILRRQMRSYFDRSAGGWDDRTGSRSPEYLAPLSAAATHVSPAPERILDIGTGTGRILELTANRIGRGIGFDINHDMLAYARTKLEKLGHQHCQVRRGDLFQLPMEDQSADAVVHRYLKLS